MSCFAGRHHDKAHSELAFLLMHSPDASLLASFLHPVFSLSQTPPFSPLWPHIDPSFPELDPEKQIQKHGELGVYDGRVLKSRAVKQLPLALEVQPELARVAAKWLNYFQ